MFIAILIDEHYHVQETYISTSIVDACNHIENSIKHFENINANITIEGNILKLKSSTSKKNNSTNFIKISWINKGKEKIRMWNLLQC